MKSDIPSKECDNELFYGNYSYVLTVYAVYR